MLRVLLTALVRLLRGLARGIGALLMRWGGDSRVVGSGPLMDDDDLDHSGEDEDEDGEGSASPKPPESNRSTAEVVTTLVSLLLICVLAGAILYDGYATGASVPASVEITVAVGGASQVGDVFHVPFEARNTGDQTIESVLLLFTIRDGDDVIEETETVLTLLGERGSASGILVLQQDPAGLDIEAVVSTFQVAEE